MSKTNNHREDVSPIKLIFDNLTKRKAAELIFGEPIENEKQKIVPVAKMQYSFGAGSGSRSHVKKTDLEDAGDGGGGHFSVKPIGVYHITKNKAQFKPITSFKFTLITLLTFGLSLILLKVKNK